MEQAESRAGLARMKYLGTFQARAGLATNKLAGIALEERNFSAREREKRERAE